MALINRNIKILIIQHQMSCEADREEQLDFQILPQLTEEQQKQLQLQHIERLKQFYGSTKQYEIESWYGELEDFTFKSHSFNLTQIQAFTLNAIYHEDQQILQRPQVLKSYQELSTKIDKFLQKTFPEGCFMKLSTRSPKDGGFNYKKSEVREFHVNKLSNLLKGQKTITKKMINKMYRYFLQQSKDKVKIKSGKQFIQLFGHSERIQIDINDLAFIKDQAFKRLSQMNYQTSNQNLINVWARQWVQCSWMEQFRCFYKDYKLNAITQYDQRCFFPQIKQKQQMIVNKILVFFDQIKPKIQKLGLSQGVMDIIVKINEESQVKLIQINIFDHNSRASLFNWQDDKIVLQEGPIQFRFHKQQIQISKFELHKILGMVQKGIQQLVKEVMQRLDLGLQWQNYQ